MNISNNYTVSFNNITESTNLDEAEYLRKELGDKHLPLQLVVPITVVYGLIFVTGVFGNVMICIVIKKNPAMQSATNYYLFNLAISDLLLLILGLPNELSIFWEQYPWKLGWGMCKLRAFVSEMSSYASVLTIVAFSLERYLAICHPLHLYTMSGLKRPIRFILLTWLVASILASPFAIYTTVNYIEYPPKSGQPLNDSAVCAMLIQNMPAFPLYELSFLIFFLIPMVFIAVLYVRMCLRIQRNTFGRSIEGSVHGETRQAHSRKAIVSMLSAVVIMFFVCWAPFHAQRLLYVQQKANYIDINEWLHPLSGCLYYFSTTVNPILYNMMSAKYRTAFKETLRYSSVKLSTPPGGNNSVTVFECETVNEFRMTRVKSSRYKRSTKYDSSEQVNMVRQSFKKVREDNNDAKTLPMDDASFEPIKSSLVVQSSNGRARCWTTRKESISSKETHI